jgi:hypothetical protein
MIDGSYQPVQVQSIHRNKAAYRVVRAGQSASLALHPEVTGLRKGMVLINPEVDQDCCIFFQVMRLFIYNIKQYFKFWRRICRRMCTSFTTQPPSTRDSSALSTWETFAKLRSLLASWHPMESTPMKVLLLSSSCRDILRGFKLDNVFYLGRAERRA